MSGYELLKVITLERAPPGPREISCWSDQILLICTLLRLKRNDKLHLYRSMFYVTVYQLPFSLSTVHIYHVVVAKRVHCSNGAGLGGFGPFLGASALPIPFGFVYMGIRWRYSRSCTELLANSRACTLARSNGPRSGGAPQFTTICGSTW